MRSFGGGPEKKTGGVFGAKFQTPLVFVFLVSSLQSTGLKTSRLIFLTFVARSCLHERRESHHSGDTTTCKVTPVILHGVVSPDRSDFTQYRRAQACQNHLVDRGLFIAPRIWVFPLLLDCRLGSESAAHQDKRCEWSVSKQMWHIPQHK